MENKTSQPEIRPYYPGMNLDPGQSADCNIMIPFPPAIVAGIERGEIQVSIENLERREVSPGHFETGFIVFLNGEQYARATLGYDQKPVPWYARLARRLGVTYWSK